MKRTLLLAITTTFTFMLLLAATPAYALIKDASNEACKGLQLSQNDTATCDTTGSGSQASSLIRLAINVFSLVVGVIAVIMIIIGGVKYITSSGDSNNVNSAKNTILYALIGLVVVALAQVIVRFVIHKTATLPECPPGATTLADGSPCKAP